MKKNFHFNWRSRSGMTLTELLVGIAVSAIIMIATITLVNYSFNAYSATSEQITNDAGLFDTTDIVNRYIRESEFCSVKDGDSTLYISMNDYSFEGISMVSKDVRIIYDAQSSTLLLDKMDGTPALVIANYITSVEWEVEHNSVRYVITQKPMLDSDETVITGFAYCRGR